MRFACQSCGKAYNLPEEKIAHKSNVKLKCRVCGAIVAVKKQGQIVATLLGESSDGPDSVSMARVSEAPPPLASGAPEAVSQRAVAFQLSPVSQGAPELTEASQDASSASAPGSAPQPPPLSGPGSVGPGSIAEPPDDDDDEATAPAPPVSSSFKPAISSPVSPRMGSADSSPNSTAPSSEPATVANPALSLESAQASGGSSISVKMLVAAFLTGFVIDRILVGLGFL